MHFRELLLQYIGVLSVAASIYNPVQTRAEYGVYDVPASVGGETAKFRSIFSMPCTDCVITRAEVQLVLKGGKSAKVESGVRLHHVVFSNPSRNDSLCQARQDGERFFASGDERGLLDLRASRVKHGYRVLSNDSLVVAGELINLTARNQEVHLSVLWNYVSDSVDEFEHITPYWLDVGGCRSASRASQSSAIFSLRSPKKSPGYSGEIVNVLGHLHSGGTYLELRRNDRTVCRLDAVYWSPPPGSLEHLFNGHHIVNMSSCKSPMRMASEDAWSLVAQYDTVAHLPVPGFLGNLEPAMGIAILYVKRGGSLPIQAVREETNGEEDWWMVTGLLVIMSVLTLILMWLWNADTLRVTYRRAFGRPLTGRNFVLSDDLEDLHSNTMHLERPLLSDQERDRVAR